MKPSIIFFVFLSFISFNTLNGQVFTQVYLQNFGNNATAPGNTLTNVNFNTVYPLILNPAITSYGRVAPNSGLLQGNYSITGNYDAASTGATFDVSSNDHSSGNGTGYLMVIDGNATLAGEVNGKYFQLPLSSLNVPGGTYRVSYFMRSLDAATASGYAPASISLSVRDNAGGTGANYITGGNPFNAQVPIGGGWTQQTTTLTIPLSFTGSTLYFNFFNPVGTGIGNDIGLDDILIEFETVIVSGNVFNDPNGNAVKDGTETNYAAPANSLFVYLVDNNNKIVDKSAVSATGIYTLNNVIFATGAIGQKLMLSNSNLAIGDPAPASASFPSGYTSTGENVGSSTGPAAGPADGIITFSTSATNFSNLDFGIEQPPVTTVVAVTNIATSQFTLTDQAGYVGMLSNDPNALPFSGNDPEDGVKGTGSTFQIINISADTRLIYNGVILTNGSTISNYQPGLLRIYGTVSGPGPSFTYSVVDNAGKVSATAAGYSLSFATPLPVTLSYFNARKSGKNTLLQWITSSEINVDRFETERSTDGTAYVKIGTVKAMGERKQTQNYAYTDAQPVPGTNYYKLKIIDKDGNFEYSYVKLISFTVDELRAGALKLYPNPASNGILNMSWPLSLTHGGTISITSVDGKTVLIQTVPAGANEITVPVKSFAQGYYFVQLVSGNQLLYKAEFVK